MSLNINWSSEAIKTYEGILEYLTCNWSANEVIAFIDNTDAFLQTIAEHPYAFPGSSHNNIRKAVIGKQNSLIYFVRNSEIYLLTFWDNRMDPSKNKY